MRNNICISNPQYTFFARRALEESFSDIKFKTVNTQEICKNWKKYLMHYFRFFDKALFFTYDLDVQRRPLLYVIILLWLSRKEAYFIDMQGQTKKINYFSLFFHYLPLFLKEIISVPFLFTKVNQNIQYISNKNNKIQNINNLHYNLIIEGRKIAYLRTDHWFGHNKAGGSIAHIKGVVDGFLKLGYSLFFLSTDKLELIEESKTRIYLIKPDGIMKNLREMPELEYNFQLIEQGRKILQKEKPEFIYQRYSLNNYAGAYLAKEFNIPFVLEYNGSFLWMSKHWGKTLQFKKITNKIGLINLQVADLIVVVSKPIKDEIVKRGIKGEKILVNPNGVNPDRFKPDIDGSCIRKKYNIDEKIVIGFIGTFGPWHGAEILAQAIKFIIKNNQKIHFLFVGDGPMMPEVKKIIEVNKVNKYVSFTGIVPQEESPKYLAACDILVSPHIPNPDGTPFFGSPTKLFEYMAMEKGIVASNLDQIGEVLKDRETAILVKPGDVKDLATGISILINNMELRKHLGQNARKEAVEKYTWDKHVEGILKKLKRL